ncbi:hypothetical protein [Streptosporangium pseudovulgare]|uniref:Uncharacterized protein n=1 Tax=Streptosporangium pseudovulgare TaxID=35765 RepID=A0ABQ2R9H0_9ACTN|nr:hypothetical protein [Streptosporangium pseudovulgare]GGQ14493.1 hypothetical protein GCM10010140_51000 [Streptosporangium pseudovulgare]
MRHRILALGAGCTGAVAAWGVANPMLGLPARRRRVTRERAAAGEAVKAPA